MTLSKNYLCCYVWIQQGSLSDKKEKKVCIPLNKGHIYVRRLLSLTVRETCHLFGKIVYLPSVAKLDKGMHTPFYSASRLTNLTKSDAKAFSLDQCNSMAVGYTCLCNYHISHNHGTIVSQLRKKQHVPSTNKKKVITDVPSALTEFNECKIIF